MRLVTVRVERVCQHSREEASCEVGLTGKHTSTTPAVTASKAFEWEEPVRFSLGEGEDLPEEMTISVRERMGHSGVPEVVGFGTVNLREALAGGAKHASIKVALSRHHKKTAHGAEAVIPEHTGDADVVIELD